MDKEGSCGNSYWSTKQIAIICDIKSLLTVNNNVYIGDMLEGKDAI